MQCFQCNVEDGIFTRAGLVPKGFSGIDGGFIW